MDRIEKSRISSSVSYYHGSDLIVKFDGLKKECHIYSFEVPTAGRAAAVAFAMLDLLSGSGFLPACDGIGAVAEVQSELEIVIAGHSEKRVTVQPENVANENTEEPSGTRPEVPF